MSEPTTMSSTSETSGMRAASMANGGTELDLLVIGAGAAGLTVAVGGARLGLRVALVERHRLGGECTWTGCVPSKALLHAAGLAHAARRAASLSAAGPPTAPPAPPAVDFARAMAHVRATREEIGATESAAVLRAAGVTVLQGQARLLPAPSEDGQRRRASQGNRHLVAVDGRRLSARHVVLATGSDPALPPVPGLAATRYLTNETLFDALDALPARLAIVGGGPIGSEMAQAFARLGSRVTLIQSGPRLLPRDDPDAADVLRDVLEREGVTVRTATRLTRATPAPGGGRGATLQIESGDSGSRLTIDADAVLVAAGRRPRTTGMDLEGAGVRVTKEGIEVDAHLQTSVPGIWAVGDCTGPFRFTHMADVQGRAVLRNILFPWRKQRMDYRVVPWTTFTDPEVGHVGSTEAAARAQHGRRIRTVRLSLKRVDRAVTEGATDGYIKLVLRGQTVLGAQVVAPRAAEMIQEVALAMQRRLPVSALSMVHIYPAYSYGLHQANDEFWRQQAASGPLSAALAVLRRLALR